MKHPIEAHFTSQVVLYVIVSMLIMSPSIAFSTPVISEPLTLESIQEYSCHDDKARVEVYGGLDADLYDAKRVVVTFVSWTKEESKLTFLTGSFGIHCPKHPLNWRAFFVFQTACPAKHMGGDPPTRCDFKNNYGVVFHSEVLIVPHPRNGKLAAELFNVDPKLKTPLAPVPVLFNVNGKNR